MIQQVTRHGVEHYYTSAFHGLVLRLLSYPYASQPTASTYHPPINRMFRIVFRGGSGVPHNYWTTGQTQTVVTSVSPIPPHSKAYQVVLDCGHTVMGRFYPNRVETVPTVGMAVPCPYCLGEEE